MKRPFDSPPQRGKTLYNPQLPNELSGPFRLILNFQLATESHGPLSEPPCRWGFCKQLHKTSSPFLSLDTTSLVITSTSAYLTKPLLYQHCSRPPPGRLEHLDQPYLDSRLTFPSQAVGSSPRFPRLCVSSVAYVRSVPKAPPPAWQPAVTISRCRAIGRL